MLLEEFFPELVLESVHRCDRQLSSHSHTQLKEFDEARHWSISVDYFGILRSQSGAASVVIVNAAKSSLGLTELGELHAYARSIEPTFAVQIAESGLSRDLYNLLLRPDVNERLLRRDRSRIYVYAGTTLDDPVSLDALFPPLVLGLDGSRFQ